MKFSLLKVTYAGLFYEDKALTVEQKIPYELSFNK
jgi:hypothetical protein